jgi:hypothetical protein
MKVKSDEQLSILHKYTFGKSACIGEMVAKSVIDHYKILFQEDEKFQQLDYSGAISAVLKGANILFVRLLQFAYQVGTVFPDVETNPMELFEEAIEGLRAITAFKEPNKKEYGVSDIKKIKIN